MLALKEKMKLFVTQMTQSVVKGLNFWLASFAENPGLSRDLGLPLGPELPDEALTSALDRLPQPSAADSALADEMAWGSRLKLDDQPSCIQIRM